MNYQFLYCRATECPEPGGGISDIRSREESYYCGTQPLKNHFQWAKGARSCAKTVSDNHIGPVFNHRPYQIRNTLRIILHIGIGIDQDICSPVKGLLYTPDKS